MWIFTPLGFYSVVQKRGNDVLTIRARVREDLDRLRTQYLPSLSPTVEGAGSDYRYRATVPHEQLSQAMAAIVRDIGYSNFKSKVADMQGPERAGVYHDVWDALCRLEGSEGDRA